MSMVYHVTRSQTNDGGGGTIGLNLEHYALYLTHFTSIRFRCSTEIMWIQPTSYSPGIEIALKRVVVLVL